MTASDDMVLATSIPPKLSRQNHGLQIGAEYQKLCIQSWIECGFRVVSVNDREEIVDLSKRYPEVTFVPTDRNASAITGRKNPYIADILRALAARPESVCGIVNSDIVFEPGVSWKRNLPYLVENSVVTARRYDTSALADGALYQYFWGLDCFFFERSAIDDIVNEAQHFAMGVPWWDYWLPFALAMKGRKPVVLDRPYIIHLLHEGGYENSAWRRFALIFAEFVARDDKKFVSAFGPHSSNLLARVRQLIELANSPTKKDAVDDVMRSLASQCVATLQRNFSRVNLNDGSVDDAIRTTEQIYGIHESTTPREVFSDLSRRLYAGYELASAASFQQQRKFPEAKERYRAALAKAPNDIDGLFNFGEFLFSTGELLEAEAQFRKTVKLYPWAAKALNSLGKTLAAMKRPGEAVTYFEKALEIVPTFAVAYHNLAVALNELGRLDEGVTRLERALVELPSFDGGAESYYRLRQDPQLRNNFRSGATEYYGQRGEDALLDAFFGFKSTGYYVDVGAFDGVHLSNSYVFERRGWSGICVEAAPRYYELCAINRPRSRCCDVACTAEEMGTVEFRVERGGLFSGINADANFIKDSFSRNGVPFEGFETVHVPSATLNAVLGDNPPGIDFASIDVEGTELDVLRGFDLVRYKPRVLLVESNTATEKRVLDEYLVERGYQWARSIEWNHFYVRTEEDRRAMRAIVVSAKLAKPPHPLGLTYGRFGYLENPYVFWPSLSE